MVIIQNIAWLLFIFYTLTSAATHRKNLGIFPKYFNFGVATSAYQIEGAWNVDGKGPNIWDNFTHRYPSPIVHGDNGDVACNSYYKYKEDVANAADLGVSLYRFSFSWSRILPNGYDTKINEKGIEYYKNLTKEILKYNMVPVATIFHWDLPQRLMDDGIEWTNPKLVDVIVKYARIVIARFPEVGWWVSINEPKQICHFGYGTGVFAPGIQSSGVDEYQCSYVVLKAHAAIYHMYKKEFPYYVAKMAPALDCHWIESLTYSTHDEEAADRQRQFECGLYFHPIYVGDWPEVVKARIANRSKGANMPKSRLPEFTPEEIKYIRGSYDYIALNHYYTILAADTKEGPANETNYNHDLGVANSFNPFWIVQNNGVFTIVPYGIRKVLNWLKQQYGDHDILITELGMTEDGTSVNDDIRVDFYTDYLCNVLSAIYEDNVHVIGVTAWSLLDNFEWSLGYSSHFGLYHVDFKDRNRKRVPKKSAKFFQQLTQSRKLYCDTPCRQWPGPMQWDHKGRPNKNKPFWRNRK